MCLTQNEMEDEQMSNRPAHEIRLGAIRAAIWQNRTQNGERYNVTLSRLYKDGDQWKDSASFGRDDLLLVAKVVNEVHSWIFEQTQVRSEAAGEGF